MIWGIGRTKARAFSLVELLISVAVLSSGIVVVLQALLYAGRVAGLSSDMVEAAFLAEDKLQELEFKEKQGILANEPAVAEGKKDKFNWEYRLNLDPQATLYQLELDISWMRPERQESLKVATYLR